MRSSATSGAVIYTADCSRLAAFYVTAIGFRECERKPDYVVLDSGSLQLVLLRTDDAVRPAAAGAPPMRAEPAPRRSDAAIKPVFHVASIAAARAAAPGTGGCINAARHEWRFGAYRVCDGLDPDGNVIQLREACDQSPSSGS